MDKRHNLLPALSLRLVRGKFGVIRMRKKPLRDTPTRHSTDMEMPIPDLFNHRSNSMPRQLKHPDESKDLRNPHAFPKEIFLSADFGLSALRPVEVAWESKFCQGFAPAARTGATLTYINRRLYLFGGECRTRFNDIKVLNPDSWRWEAVQPAGADPPPDPRVGHSAVAFRNSLAVFGGAGQFNTMLKIRSCYNRVHLYDTVSSTWKTAETIGYSPQVRRSHSCAVLGNTMVVYGGLDELGNALDDIFTLNLETLKWSTPKLHRTSGPRPGKRHSACLIPAYQLSTLRQYNFDIYHTPQAFDEVFTKANSGMYMFGGVNHRGAATNDLFVLRPKPLEIKDDDYYLKWSQPEVGGTPPEARYAHCGALRGKFLVFFGGRNNTVGDVSVASLALLNLEAMRWETAVASGVQPVGRWGSACACSGSEVVVFGGMRLEEYFSGPLVLEFAHDYRQVHRRTIKESRRS